MTDKEAASAEAAVAEALQAPRHDLVCRLLVPILKTFVHFLRQSPNSQQKAKGRINKRIGFKMTVEAPHPSEVYVLFPCIGACLKI